MTSGAHLLTVRSAQATMTLPVATGISVREALDATDLRVRAACGGTGACGACTVRLLSGRANAPTPAEHAKLTADERQAGARLACQLRLAGDAEILVDSPAPPSPWQSIAAEDLTAVDLSLPELADRPYGVAVDLGTTRLRVSLWDRKHGRRIATRQGANPQAVFGADVLNRLAAARVPERAAALTALARNAVVDAVQDMLARDLGEVSPLLAEIGHVVVAGNSAMLALLTGRGGEALLDPDNWQRPVDCQAPGDPAWHAAWRMPNAHIEILPPVAGFVGSDLLADLVATGLADGRPGALLVDLGTNTEIALWDGRIVHATSVPGGPAFESGGIAFGMPAETGAVCAVRRRADGFDLEVIGGTEARGFCGSGLLDAVAALLATGIIKPSGRFAVPCPPQGYRLDPANPRTTLAGAAIDAFQRAKAATAAAIAMLLAEAGLNHAQVGRVVICGAFGHRLDLASAHAVGLLPDFPRAGIELLADAALGGCEMLLLSRQSATRVQKLAQALSLINATLLVGYEDRFIEELRLRRTPATV